MPDDAARFARMRASLEQQVADGASVAELLKTQQFVVKLLSQSGASLDEPGYRLALYAEQMLMDWIDGGR